MEKVFDFKKASFLSVGQILEELQSTPSGLSQKEARKRLLFFGKNQLEEKGGGIWQILSRQFKNAFLYLLIGASFISFFLGQNHQGLAILLIIFLTTLFGFILEFRSQKSEEKLASFLKDFCWVKREEKREKIEESFLVPGDIVFLEAGEIVPADCRLIKKENLLIDEAILTGESEPATKEVKSLGNVKNLLQAKNLLFGGTAVVWGTAEAVVFATGEASQIGKISQLVAATSGKSSFEKTLNSLSLFILKVTILTLFLIFGANILIKGFGPQIGELALFTIALAVGIVPEALPVVALLTMSLGALSLAKKKVIVKRLTALEDLGNIEVLCVDKTGTLTENQLSLVEIFTDERKYFSELFYHSVFPILGEKKTLRSYLDQTLLQEIENKPKGDRSVLVFNEPFRPDLRQDRILVKVGERLLFICKGAPEILLKNCRFEGKTKKKGKLRVKFWQELLEEEGRKGRRVYGMAVKEIPNFKTPISDWSEKLDQLAKEMVFVGFASLADPIKKTAISACRKAWELGVRVKILTDDTPQVAGWVGKEIGLLDEEKEVILGEELEKFSGSEFKKMVLEKKVFARVTPEQKYKIVQVLEKDYSVGFLGDGVNDAPALKVANVSLAVDTAADVAKQSADVILLQKDLGVILEGVEQGRKIFANVLKYIKYTLASNFGNSYSLAVISLFIPFLPMLPAQILLVNLLSDFPLIFVAVDNVDPQQLKKPVRFDLRQIGFLIIFLGLISVVFDFLFFAIFRRLGPARLQTLWFIESVLSEIVFIFSIRSHFPFFKAKAPALPLWLLSILTIVFAILVPFSFLSGIFSFTPPSLPTLLAVFLIVLLYFAITEIVKLWCYNFRDISS